MAAGPALNSRTWTRYYAAAGEAPRQTLLQALDSLRGSDGPPATAVDLGCGTGRDTLELLRRGWRVLAIDAEGAAIEPGLTRTPWRAAIRSRPSSRASTRSSLPEVEAL